MAPLPAPVDKSFNGEMVPSKGGRPSNFTLKLGAIICSRMEEGETLSAICRDVDMPHRGTVLRWVSKDSAFRDTYALARLAQMDRLGDECLEIADDGTTDYILKKGRNGVEYEAVDQEHIQRSRLRFDARRFLMSKLAPHIYGDHLDVQHSGQVTHQHELSDRELARRMAYFLTIGGGALLEQSPTPDGDESGTAVGRV